MRVFKFNEYDGKEGYLTYITDEKILDIMFEYLSKLALSRGMPNITEEDCIDEFVVVHWAWEEPYNSIPKNILEKLLELGEYSEGTT